MGKGYPKGHRRGKFGSVKFAEAEVKTNDVWIDGKPIFIVVCAVSAGPNNNTVAIAHGITGLDFVVDICGTIESSGTRTTLPNGADGTAGSSIRVLVGDVNVNLISTGDYSLFSGYFILRYTKD